MSDNMEIKVPYLCNMSNYMKHMMIEGKRTLGAEVEAAETGTITKWYKKVGDKVNENDLLLDIETRDFCIEVNCETEGTITKIYKHEGQKVKSDEVIGKIEFSKAEIKRREITQKLTKYKKDLAR